VTLEGHTEGVRRATLLPDGRILSWSGDNVFSEGGTLRLWEGATGALLVTLEGHTHRVNGAALLSDGRILSWSADYTLRLWEGSTGAPLVTLKGHRAEVNGALVLPDSRILSWSDDNTLRVWEGSTGAPLVTLNWPWATHPELRRAWRQAVDPDTLCSQTSALDARGGPRLWFYPPAATGIDWHADGDWTARHLLPDGTLVATCDKHLAILHLHHGYRRVTIEEAEALLAGGYT
jgi:WD40 repeat protein